MSTGRLRIVETTMLDKLPAVQALLREHWEELVLDPATMPLQLDVARYQELEAAGILLCLVAYDGEEIVGYSAGVLFNHPHHADVRMLSNDALFLRKSHRKGRNGVALIRATERAARQHGAAKVLWNAEPGTALEALLPVMGYRAMNTIFGKGL